MTTIRLRMAISRKRRCCMDQWERRTHPYPVLGSCDAVESRTGAVAWAIRHHPVSRPRSSNAACGFPARRSPTGFTAQHTTRPVFARECAVDAVFALPQSSFRRLLALPVFVGSRQSPCPRHPQKRTRSQGPSLHRRYPASAVSGRRRRARLLSRWPPSAAQTGRAVFPHPAFTKMRFRRRLSEGIR